jgi:leader peptidase (prepilin peptidase)/N-methyltransferase
MGFGDVKYVLVMGWLLGWQRVIVGLFLAFCIGAIVGVILLSTKRKKLKQHIPFGPFLVVGTILALVWGNPIWNWYMGFLN